MHDPELHALRYEYEAAGLDVGDLHPDPLVQVRRWLDDATAAGLAEPNAMVVATASRDGRPSARTVLCKGFEEGVVFFTNYESRKGIELAENPRASAVFLWIPLHRQIRIDGTVERIPSEASDAYFASRPPGARIGAAASPQSRVIPDREWLEARVAEITAAQPDGDLPRPPHWGGYRILPNEVELWQGRTHRLHDRLRYRLEGDGWVVERLAP